jgi:two-component system NtrC family sensor kinase
MQKRRDAALRSLWLMLAACLVLPAALLFYAAWSSYHQSLQLADERNEHSLALSSEQALRVFRSLSVTFDTVDQITAYRDEASLRASEAELHQRLKQAAAAMPEIASIWILDASGDAIATSLVYPLPGAFNGAERAHLKSQLAPGPQLHIGELLEIKLTGRTIFPVSKRRTSHSGAFAGYALISVSPRLFERFYEPLGSRTGGSFALIREDGAVLARYPLPSASGIRLGPSTGFGQLIAANPDGGNYTTVSDVDKIERRIMVRRLDGFPLYVTSSLRQNEIVKGWLRHVASLLMVGLPAVAVLIALILLAIRRTSALYAESARREALEGVLRHSQKMEAIGQLTGGIAHDFNNLLMVVGGSLDALSRHITLDAKAERLINAARLGVDRGAKLNQQLLAFGRRQDLNFQPVCVADLLPEFRSLLERAVGDSIQVRLAREPGLWHCRTDPNQLETAILNLAINSRDAMPKGGDLRIEAFNAVVDQRDADLWDATPGDYVAIRVIDTGTGIPKPLVSRAFEPFFTTKSIGKGTGLGLSQVYGFAKQSNGFATLQSTEGVGTTVSLYLPRTAASPVTTECPAAPAIEEQAGTLLIVEDDPDVRMAAQSMAEELGYSVHLAGNGAEALHILDHTEADIVFSDVLMPGGMSGFDLAARIEQLYPEMPVLLTSGYTGEHPDLATQSRTILLKPYTLTELAAALRAARDVRSPAVSEG